MAGLLYVTMQPKGLPDAVFHDWYNNEHGPLRLRLPFIQNGLRYRAVDLDGDGQGLPEWLAVYDVADMKEMVRPAYLALREMGPTGGKTQREQNTMAQIDVDRRLYDFLEERCIPGFSPLEANCDDRAAVGATLVSVTLSVRPGREDDVRRWYREEHMLLLSKIPGWRRSRCFFTSAVDLDTPREMLALHEYAPQNGLGGEVHRAAALTPAHKEIMSDAVLSKRRRVYQWYYTFGPAPRELTALTSSAVTSSWTSNDGRSRTIPSSTRPALESFITTPDGVDLAYRLEGSAKPDAPLLVLSNSILVDWQIWDGFVDGLLRRPDMAQRYRVLRYATRGRTRNCGSQPINLDLLAADVLALLDALRVPPASAIIIGVSLGGVTALNTALQYPDRVAAFIACDTNSASPSSNQQAWSDRVTLAESEGAVSPTTGEPIVGERLAEATTRRWLVPGTYDSNPDLAAKLRHIVATNSLDGFRQSVQALCGYDVRERMAHAKVPGLLVVGECDGILPRTMPQMASDLHGTAELKVIPAAGHLPMVEQPDAFTEVVCTFLNGIE